VAVFQFAPRLRALAENASRIASVSGDLVVTPELSLTGYDLRDDVGAVAIAGVSEGMCWSELSRQNAFENVGPTLVGAVIRAATSVPFNAALLIDHDVVRHVHRKIYLPTYGMFDEARYFGSGQHVQAFQVNGWTIGVLICEDFWHPLLTYLHAMQGVDALVVMAAAPGRGAWSGGEEGGFFASSDSWERIARAYAQLYGIYVVVCNRCGVEGGVTFAGESFVVAPDARVVARAGTAEEVLRVQLDADAVRGARTPYAHIRDEDARLAVREIERIMAAQ
jgi:predicted amidohydrolase